jgi:hypothetical protein
MLAAKIISSVLSLALVEPAEQGPAPEPAEVQSVFDMGLDAPPPAPPEPRADAEVHSVFDMELGAPPPPSPSADTKVVASGPQPSRLVEPPPSKLRQAGWGTLIGGFALASIAGVSFGFAERERSRTRRLSLAYDLYGTSPRPLPADIAATLDASRRSQTRFSLIAAGLAAGAVLAWVASGVMLGVARKRRRAGRVQAALGTVRF